MLSGLLQLLVQQAGTGHAAYVSAIWMGKIPFCSRAKTWRTNSPLGLTCIPMIAPPLMPCPACYTYTHQHHHHAHRHLSYSLLCHSLPEGRAGRRVAGLHLLSLERRREGYRALPRVASRARSGGTCLPWRFTPLRHLRWRSTRTPLPHTIWTIPMLWTARAHHLCPSSPTYPTPATPRQGSAIL